jgi:Flp pilus assembly protein TadG
MRRLMNRLRDERGATALIVGILLVPLTGFVAISVDVGALYAERGQLQNGADSAALAIAQECAEDDSCDDPNGLAALFTDANANDAAANNLVPEFPDDHTVTVTSSTLDASGNNAIQHPFASLIGVDSTTVYASATAEWGSPRASMTVLPLALSYCEFTASEAAAPDTLMLIRYDTNVSCKGPEGHPIPGGFGWLARPDKGCQGEVDLDEGTAKSEPGNSYPGACDATLATLKGTTVLVPIFDDAVSNKGKVEKYQLYGFAAFTITGWKFSGGGSPQVDTDPAAPKCTGSCRGIQGYFTEWVSLEDAGDVVLGGPNLGATIVRLID